MQFIVGQRWASRGEPELGIGIITGLEDRQVTVAFPGSGEVRVYATDEPPLDRVRFVPGDRIPLGDSELVVESIGEVDGLLVYRGDGGEILEQDLPDAISFSRPEERLIRGDVDESATVALRLAARQHLQRLQTSPVRGLVGARIDLIPHQMYVVDELCRRPVPRALLADEVGLGKTIEACLVMHRLLLTGRAARVLVVVPETLVHQWFVELLRRFNMRFSLYDEERCEALEANADCDNPFLDDEWILADVAFLSGNPRRARQVVEAGWDLVIVDEAHHLSWSPEAVSTEYALVERLAAISPGLLLLTATPEETGPASHFARLRLLDPVRYHDLAGYERAVADAGRLLPLVERLSAGKAPKSADRKLLQEMGFSADASVAELAAGLLDRFGAGRVMFRNTRRHLTGFPQRQATLYPLGSEATAGVRWLSDLLRRLAADKVLLICRSQAQALRLRDELKAILDVRTAVFHEDQSLIERDRGAAWFADPEGARLLITSAIGGEGRNFQFAHHLVLYDVPANPEVLEQRIGRLDRIGQTHTIQIHVPYVPGTESETLALWYHLGLNAFERPVRGAWSMYCRFHQELEAQVGAVGTAAWDALLAETRELQADLEKRLDQGLDRLLELQSFREDVAQDLIKKIRKVDGDRALDSFMSAVFERYGVHPDDHGERTVFLEPDHHFSELFPAFPREGMVVTSDRRKALAREDVGFLTWDHPLVTGALDLVLGEREGTSALAVREGVGKPGVLLELVYLLTPIGRADDPARRFLAETPIRVLLNPALADIADELPAAKLEPQLRDASDHPVRHKSEALRKLLNPMLAAGLEHASKRRDAIVKAAATAARRSLQVEIDRLHAVAAADDALAARELALLASEQERLRALLHEAPISLDSVRLIIEQ